VPRQPPQRRRDCRDIARLIAGKAGPPADLLPLLTGAASFLSQAITQHRDAPAAAELRSRLQHIARMACHLAAALDDADVLLALDHDSAAPDRPEIGLHHRLHDLAFAADEAAARIKPGRGKRRQVAPQLATPEPRLFCAWAVCEAWPPVPRAQTGQAQPSGFRGRCGALAARRWPGIRARR
jgi:hypothetical protein